MGARATNDALTVTRKRLTEGGYSPDVRDIALGEDPEWRRNRQVTPVDIAMILGGATDTQTVANQWPTATVQLVLL